MSRPNPLRTRGSLIDALSSALDRGNHGLENVPGLLKRILAEESWREFETARGEHVVHERFESFVTAPPLKGLGASTAVIERIVGTDDPDLLRLLRDARKGAPGRPSAAKNRVESTPISKGEDSSLTVQRLAVEAPSEYEAVKRGEKTINAAAISAGIRRRRVSVRLDNPRSAAETLRKHMSREQLAELRALLAAE